MKLPIVPAIKSVAMIRPIFLVTKSRMKAHMPATLISKITVIGMGSDREIPVFNTGKTRDISFRKLLL
jgi:hypothetical protein